MSARVTPPTFEELNLLQAKINKCREALAVGFNGYAFDCWCQIGEAFATLNGQAIEIPTIQFPLNFLGHVIEPSGLPEPQNWSYWADGSPGPAIGHCETVEQVKDAIRSLIDKGN